jgi:glycosyltransferase involved in cell wall biosynthesis
MEDPVGTLRLVLSVLRYLPALGGSTRVVQLLAEGVAARGHDVTVVTQEEPSAPGSETINRVKIHRLRMRHLAGFRVPRGYLQLLRHLDADVFHLHGNRIWCADYYFPFVRSFGWNQVLTPHGFYHYWMRPGALRWLYYDQYFRRRIRAFDRYIALTAGERDQVLGWKFPPEHLALVPNGIDPNEFATASVGIDATRAGWGLGTPHVGVYVGGLYDNKRVDRVIRSLASTGGTWGLVVFGPDVPGTPFDLAHCDRLARELHVPVRFLGPQSREVVVRSIAAADAYLQGSAFEGYGIALLEAMAAGVPFVAFDAGAARDLAATGAGFAVTSEAEMAARLPELLAHRDGMVRAARAAIPNFTADRMVDRHLELYRSIV